MHIKKERKKCPISFGGLTDNDSTLYKHESRIGQQTIIGLNSTKLIYEMYEDKNGLNYTH